MASITGNAFLADIDLYSSSTTVPGGLYVGQRIAGKNGKEFVYSLAGAANLVVGNLLQSSATDTQFEDMAVPAATVIGDQSVTITNGTTAVTANQFDGGSLLISVTPGLGEEYTVVSHGAATSGQPLTVFLDRPLRTAWTTSTKVSLKRSPYSGVIQFPATTQTGIAAGVAIYNIPAAQYGWVQVKGLCAALSDGSTFAIGTEVGTPSGTAGAVTVYAAGTTHMRVGVAQRAAASGKDISVMLML